MSHFEIRMYQGIKDLQFNCDRLWKLWYSLLIILLEILIISLAISNYLTYREQAFDSRFGNNWLLFPMNFQLAAIILSISTMVFFIYACIFKVGNVANDGIELGIDPFSIRNALQDISLNKGISLFLSRLATHILPYSAMIHVIIALVIALPVPLLQAEQIRNEAISKEWIWKTDIDFFVNPGGNYLQENIQTTCYNGQPCEYPLIPSAILPEYINLAISLLIITVRMPTPFWYTNKAFSIVFSLFSFVTTLSILFEYQAIISFIKIFHNYEIISQSFNYWISEWSIIIMFFIKCLFMLSMNVIVFEYGYTQFLTNMRKYRQYLSFDISDSVSQQSINNQHVKWYQIAPRVFGVIILLITIIISFPIIQAFVKLNNKLSELKQPIPTSIILALILIAIYFIICVFLWFGLCVKNKWQFHINFQSYQPAMNMDNMGVKIVTESPEPVYGCFYNAPSLSSHTSVSKPTIIRSSLDGSDAGSQRNYVYMHPSVIPIHERSEYNINVPGGSEVSYCSNTKSYDSADINRYKNRFMNPITDSNNFVKAQMLENSQYTTLDSLKSKGLYLSTKQPSNVLPSDSSSSDNYSRHQTQRRGSNRVTFKEEHTTINNINNKSGELFNFNTKCNSPPDILTIGNNGTTEQTNDIHDIDPDLEMSTDMRQLDEEGITSNNNGATIFSDKTQNENLPDKRTDNSDPKMCSQV